MSEPFDLNVLGEKNCPSKETKKERKKEIPSRRLTRTVADQTFTLSPFRVVVVQCLVEDHQKSSKESGQEGVEYDVEYANLDWMCRDEKMYSTHVEFISSSHDGQNISVKKKNKKIFFDLKGICSLSKEN